MGKSIRVSQLQAEEGGSFSELSTPFLHPKIHPDTHLELDHQSGIITDIMLTALYHSPYTGDGNWTDGPGIFPHYVVLRKVVTGGKVISGPLARSAGRACELISQVFMRLAGCTDPAAVFTWETGI